MSPVREEGDALVDDLFGPLDGEAGPARRISRAKTAALVIAALESASHEVTSRPRLRRKRPPVWLMSVAVLFTGAAAAAVWMFARAERAREPQVTRAMPEVARPPGDGVPVDASAPASASVRPVEAALPDSARAVNAGPHASGASPLAPVVAAPPEVPRRDGTAFPARKQRTGTPARMPPAAAPEDLLREANALRAGGRWRDAESLYLRVIREQPASLAAYVARVASGSLRLEHLGNARGALRQFQDALRLQPQGVLGQEARHGSAEAWRALGDRNAEARALEELLTHHPDSPLGTTARARLRELSAP